MQGNSSTDRERLQAKIEALAYLFEFTDVILLQECGNFTHDIPPNWIAYDNEGGQAGALNGRCSICTLSRGEESTYIGRVELSSTTGRPLLVSRFRDFIIGNFHAVASGNAAVDATTAMQHLTSNYQNIVLGGDFNLHRVPGLHPMRTGRRPEQTHQHDTRQGNLYTFDVPAFTTHNSDKTLDYFAIAGRVSPLELRSTPYEELTNPDASDHSAVIRSYVIQ
jgi:hypothetical protein